MRTIIAILVAVCFLMAPMAAFAGQGSKGPSQEAYKKADENAKFLLEEKEDGSKGKSKAKKRKRIEETKEEDKGKGEKERIEKRERQEETKSE